MTDSKLLNKKVILYDKSLTKIIAVGKLHFLGKNELLKHWNLQATINRTPYRISHLNQVVLFDEELVRLR